MSKRLLGRSAIKTTKFPSHQPIIVLSSLEAYNAIGIEPRLQRGSRDRPLTRIHQRKLDQQKNNHIIDKNNLVKNKNILIPNLGFGEVEVVPPSFDQRNKKKTKLLSGIFR